MNRKLLILLAILIVLVVGALFYYLNPGQEVIVEDEKGLPSEVVSAFIESFIQSAPPAIPGADEEAFDLLAEGTQAMFSDDVSLAGQLAMFVGVQDIPDLGYEISSEEVMEEKKVQVETIWRYTGMEVERYFILVEEEGGWKILEVRLEI